jgi:hypothetical protein
MSANGSPAKGEQMTKESVTGVFQEQAPSPESAGQTSEEPEWLRELGDLEAQPEVRSSVASRSPPTAPQVDHKQLSARLLENMDDDDLLDLMERGGV